MFGKTPQTAPNYPPKGGVVWGGLGGLFGHRFGVSETALFSGSVFDHKFGLVLGATFWTGFRPQTTPKPSSVWGWFGGSVWTSKLPPKGGAGLDVQNDEKWEKVKR